MKYKRAIWPQASAKFPFLSLSFGYFSSSMGCHKRCQSPSSTSPVIASPPTSRAGGQFELFSEGFCLLNLLYFSPRLHRGKTLCKKAEKSGWTAQRACPVGQRVLGQPAREGSGDGLCSPPSKIGDKAVQHAGAGAASSSCPKALPFAP